MASSSSQAADDQERNLHNKMTRVAQRREARTHLRAIDRTISEKKHELYDPTSDRLASVVKKSDEVFGQYEDTMEGREVAMDTHNMAQLGSIASRQASTLNTFVNKERVISNLVAFYGPDRPGRESEPPALAGSSFNWGLLGMHMSALWRAPPSWDVLRGTFDSVLQHDAAVAQARAAAAAKRALQPTKARLVDDGRAAATADTVQDTVTSRTAAANAQRVSELLRELQALMEDAPVVALAQDAPRAALPLVHTLLDPWSFTQSVENVFFFSTLVKKRQVGVDIDKAGNPVIVLGTERLQDASGDSAGKGGGTVANTLGKRTDNSTYQFVWNLDRPLWRAALDVFGITRPALTHRDSSDSTAPPGAHVARFYGGMAHRRKAGDQHADDSDGGGSHEMLLPVATGAAASSSQLLFDDADSEEDEDGGSDGTPPPPRRGTKRARPSSGSPGRVVSAARGRRRSAGSTRGRTAQESSESD